MGILQDTQPDATTSTAPSTAENIGNIASGVLNTVTGGLTSGITSGLMGMLFGGQQDKRQIEQQQQLQNQQVKGAEELGAFSQEMQMKTWNETNYEAQVKHLENAGLNPALLYAKGGPGGTLGGGATPMPSGGTAASAAQTQSANNESMMMGMQLQQMKAQTDLAEAQADKAKADADKTRGADTTNENQNTLLQAQQTEIAKAQAQIQGKTIEEQINTIIDASKKMEADASTAFVQNEQMGATYKDNINIVHQTLSNLILQGLNTAADTKVKDADAIIEQYKAGMAQMGIDPNSPWYLKTVTAIANKLGIIKSL